MDSPSEKQKCSNKQDSFLKNVSSRTQPELIESDSSKKIIINFIKSSQMKYIIKISSRITSIGAVFEERFNRTIKDIRWKVVLKDRDSNLAVISPTITKQFFTRIHF